MKLLIVTNNLLPYTNANSGIVYQIAEQLAHTYSVDVSLVGDQTGEIPADPLYPSWYLPSTYRYTQVLPEHLPKWKKLMRLLCHPELWEYRRSLVQDRYPRQKLYERTLEKVLQEQPDFDCILCVTCPYDTVMAAAHVVKDVPLVTYKLDPWGTHMSHQADRQYWADEQAADARCEAIFVTGPIYQDYVSGVNQAPLEKVHQLEFPNLTKPVWRPELSPQFEAGKLHCAYVGQLYPGIRSPEFLFDLFRRFEKENVVLHIIGNTDLQAEQYRDKIPANTVLHGIVSPEEAAMYMQAADVLVNLGNTVANQLPSKLISYLACGKPILNLCKISNCPSLPYMDKYPLSMNVMEENGLQDMLVEQVMEFFRTTAGENLTFAQVAELYPECTPEYVVKQVYEVLCSAVESKGKGKAH